MNPYIFRCFWDRVIFHSLISESILYLRELFASFSQLLTGNWSWQDDESVPGALYSIMLSPIARKEPEVRRQGTWRDFTLTFERWKEWLGISVGLGSAAIHLSKRWWIQPEGKSWNVFRSLYRRGYNAGSLCDRLYSLPCCASYSTI